MKHTLKSLFVFLLLITVFSCDENDQVTTENCTITTVTNYDGDDGEELMQATYQNGKIVQFLGPSLKYTYEYDSQGRIATKYYIELAQGLNDTIKIVYSYNADNTIYEEKYYLLENGIYELYARLQFQYSNGKHSTTDLYDYENNVETFEGTTTYFYTGNNITSIQFDDSDSDVDYDYLYEFTIDTTKQNPFHTISSQMYAMDTYIDDDTFFILPIYSNSNVVTSIKETENGFAPHTENIVYVYETSPQGNNLLSQVTIDGSGYYKFSYSCN